MRKRKVRLPGFDEKVLSLYARGMITRELQDHLDEIYEVEAAWSRLITVSFIVRLANFTCCLF